MGKVIMSGVVPLLTVPLKGVPASELMEGTEVMIEENGVPIPFLLAKQNYESTLNGDGRILFVRKNGYEARAWGTIESNNYSGSYIDNRLNSVYKSVLSSKVQELIGNTTFTITKGNQSKIVQAISRPVFILAAIEMGLSNTNASSNIGTPLPIASVLKQGVDFDDKTVPASNDYQWTRSAYLASDTDAWAVTSKGKLAYQYLSEGSIIRPCFTLPSDAVFAVNSDGLVTLKA